MSAQCVIAFDRAWSCHREVSNVTIPLIVLSSSGWNNGGSPGLGNRYAYWLHRRHYQTLSSCVILFVVWWALSPPMWARNCKISFSPGLFVGVVWGLFPVWVYSGNGLSQFKTMSFLQCYVCNPRGIINHILPHCTFYIVLIIMGAFTLYSIKL